MSRPRRSRTPPSRSASRAWARRSLLAAALIAGACGPDQEPSRPVRRLGGIPVREGATSPPGTPLGAGFSVADGVHLVGAVFPNELDDGWRAVLLVTGDAGAVFEAYRQQAAAAGVPFRAEPTCEVTDDTLTCGVRGVSDDGLRVLEVDVWRGRVGHDRTPVSHAYIELTHPATPATRRGPAHPGPVTVAAPALPTGWELPGVGQRFIDDLTVEPDSELVAPVAPVPGGLRGVFRIHANPVEVMRGYDRQWRNDPAVPPPTPWSDPDGAYVLVDTGVDHRIEIVSRPGHPTWAWVTASRAW